MPSLPRILGALAILSIIGAGLTWLYRQGGASVAQSIERQDNEAGNQADRARSDYDGCLDRDWVWDYGAGQCTRPTPDRRP